MISASDWYSKLTPRQKEDLWRQSPGLWATDAAKLGPGLEGIDWLHRPWFHAMYESKAQHMVIRKTPQIGVSTLGLMRCFHGAKYRWTQGFGYYLPHDAYVGPFVRQKVNPILENTPGLGTTAGADNMGVKAIGNCHGFFRGIDSPTARQIISIDCLIRDEFDLMNPEHTEDVEGRLDGSSFKEIIDIGIPTVPGWGIDASFEGSTANWWTMTCKQCEKPWTIEETWPTCVKDGHLCCPNCGRITAISEGEWIPRGSGDIEGYTMNALMNPNADIPALLTKWETGKHRAIQRRNLLGLPSRESGGESLNAKEVLARLCGKYDQLGGHDGPTWGGADVGGSAETSPVIIADKPKGGKARVIYIADWNDWSDLDTIMRVFHVERFVIDALPENREAKKFAKRWPGRVFICYYVGKRGGGIEWNKPERGMVEVDRTESLDDSHEPLYTGLDIELPGADDPEVRKFALHCEGIHKIEKETPKGNTVGLWEKTGPDHRRHAFNYLWVAMNAEKPKLLVTSVGPPNSLPSRLRRPMNF